MKIKIAILFLMIMLVISSVVVGAYAWMIAPSEGLDMNIRTSELFSARMIATIGTNQIDYNDPLYNESTLTITMTKSQVQSNTSNGVMPLTIDVAVNTQKNIRVRVKLVELWVNNSNVIISRPNVFNFTYNSSSMGAVDADGYRMFNDTILKDTIINVPFVSSAAVNLNNMANGTTVKLSVVVTAIQANRVGVWSDPLPSVTTTLSSMSNASVVMNFNGVANQQFGRGAYIELAGVTNGFKYTYIWHNRFALTDKLSITGGQYKIYINLVNYVSFTVSNTSSVLTINVSYNTNSNWGYEDVLFSPHTIANWTYGVQYYTGDIVYFDDPDEGEDDQSGFYIATNNNSVHRPDYNSWAWRLMGPYYTSGTMFTAGTIIFFNGTFYKARTNTWSSPTSDPNAWERLDRMYSSTNTYPAGGVVFTEDSYGNRTYFYATAAIGTYEPPASWSDWKQMGFPFSTINAGSKYEIGEVVYYDGDYWRVTVKGWLNAPAQGANGWAKITSPNPSSWSSGTTYSQWNYITHNGKFYYLRSGTSLGQEPGTAGNQWQELTENWVSTNAYRNPTNNTIKQMVYHAGGIYVWYGADNSNSTTAPGTDRNGWTELTELWRYYNQYYVGDRVIYDGSYWEALQSPYDGNGDPIVPGSNFTVWHEYEIVWDPNRNA